MFVRTLPPRPPTLLRQCTCRHPFAALGRCCCCIWDCHTKYHLRPSVCVVSRGVQSNIVIVIASSTINCRAQHNRCLCISGWPIIIVIILVIALQTYHHHRFSACIRSLWLQLTVVRWSFWRVWWSAKCKTRVVLCLVKCPMTIVSTSSNVVALRVVVLVFSCAIDGYVVDGWNDGGTIKQLHSFILFLFYAPLRWQLHVSRWPIPRFNVIYTSVVIKWFVALFNISDQSGKTKCVDPWNASSSSATLQIARIRMLYTISELSDDNINSGGVEWDRDTTYSHVMGLCGG